MNIPALHGIIRRRILVNYRIDPAALARVLPEPFRPKLHAGYGVGGICLIRLEQVRPRFVPLPIGITSENAAHRVAVEWDEGNTRREGVFIPRRDSSSLLNHLAGGRVFPGEHHRADFVIADDRVHVDLAMSSRDGVVKVELSADVAPALPPSSIFGSLEESSSFFERGALGYSATEAEGRYHGLVLETVNWKVAALDVKSVHSSYFESEQLFPHGSVEFDHALIMRDIQHQWLAAPDLYGERTPPALEATGSIT
jgi:hypothetical protein